MKGRGWIIFIMVTMLTACKYDTFEEAFANDIPFNVKKVLHTEEVEDGKIVLYITEQEREREPIEALAVAYIRQDENGKWENVGNNHWEYEENSQMTVYENTFYYYDNKGNIQRRIPLIYGTIQNQKIQKIEVAAERYRRTEAEMIDDKYFINLGSYLIVQGKDAHDNVVEEYKKK